MGEEGDHAVIHVPARGAWQEVNPPGDLGPLFGKEARHRWAWTQSENEHCPKLLPKWPFEPVAIEVPPFVPEDEEEEDFPVLWPDNDMVHQRIAAAQGGPAEPDYFTIRDFVDGQAARRPFAEFPHDWRAVQICSALMVKKAEFARRYREPPLFDELAADLRDPRIAAIGGEAQTWFDRAAAKAPFEAVPQADRDEFWDFLVANPRLSPSILCGAVPVSVVTSLAASAEAAARVPPEIAKRVRTRHTLATRTDGGLHVNIPDRMLAPPVDIQGNQWERAKSHVLLLEISSNEGLGHRFGEGVYQFWIGPEDLLAGRFNRVELTSDAY